MATIQTFEALPTWILMIVTIAVVGILALIYTRGNWKTTFTFVGLAMLATLFIAGFDAWHAYLSKHFIGEYDALGIPFRKAGPGWAILHEAWPLWLVPMGVAAVLAIGIDAIVKRPSKKAKIIKEEILDDKKIIDQKNIAQKLGKESTKIELEELKIQLEKTLRIAEEQIDRNLDLEIRNSQLEEEKQQITEELKEKMVVLEYELHEKRARNEELTALTLEQTEAIIKLKNE